MPSAPSVVFTFSTPTVPTCVLNAVTIFDSPDFAFSAVGPSLIAVIAFVISFHVVCITLAASWPAVFGASLFGASGCAAAVLSPHAGITRNRTDAASARSFIGATVCAYARPEKLHPARRARRRGRWCPEDHTR